MSTTTTLVAFCSQCFSKQMIMCRKDTEPLYWFVCSLCGAETAQVTTLNAVNALTLWVPIDALLDAPQIAT